jgi:3-deoxy-D-arabino-heptulosonate 7-phosphate (DAHP) synthase
MTLTRKLIGPIAAVGIFAGTMGGLQVAFHVIDNNAQNHSYLALDPRGAHVPKDNVNRGPRRNMPGQRQHQ